MIRKKRNGLVVKIVVYLFFILLITWAVHHSGISLKIRDGIGILVGLFLIHTCVENVILLRRVNMRCENQAQVIKQIFEHCPDLIVIKDSNLQLQVCNDAMLKLFNVEKSRDVTSKIIGDVLSKEAVSIIRKYDEMVLKHARVVKFKVKKVQESHQKIYEVVSTPMMAKDSVSVVGVLSISRDITAKEELKQQLMEKQCHLASILDNLSCIAYLKDLDGRIIRGNSKLEEHLKMPFHKIMARTAQELFLNYPEEYMHSEDKEIIEKKLPVESERKIDMFNTGVGWYRITKSPILNENGEATGIAVLLKNIDKEKEIEAQKETFVATLTHDLKTPTIAQIRALELLIENSFGEINEKQKEMLEQILKSCRYMLSMISHVLSTYKFENGDAKLRNVEFNFTLLVDECCQEVSNLAKDKSLQFIQNFNVKDNLITGDRIQLKRVLVNILSNAVSYAYENTEIEVILEEKDGQITFYTVNKSVYIPSDILNRIFDKYVSGPSVKFNKVGTGLGLYLSEKIINAHHGVIIAKSTKDNKNTFGFVIPKSPLGAKVLAEA